MSDRSQKAVCIVLLAAACCISVIPGLVQPVQDHSAVYNASGREVRLPVIPGSSGTVSVNTADAEELQTLPGIGETLSAFIVSERLNNGDYYYPEDLTAVKGIGIKKLEQFRELLDFSQGGD